MSRILEGSRKARKRSVGPARHKKPVSVIIDNLIMDSDLIIEVLDARFIEKTRNLFLEKRIKAAGKVLIYLLNKSDLVDINKIKKEEDVSQLKPGLFFSSKERKGTAVLRKLIKMEAKKVDKDRVNIGVLGYPNVGKSSVINLIAGRASSKTSSEAGYTKSIQKIKISEEIYLIDAPGIVPPEDWKSSVNKLLAKHSKIGAVTWYKAKDPEMIVFELMKEYPGILERHYNLDSKGDSEDLIERLGRKLNHLKKGGLVDEIRTSKQILRDWQEGKIRV